ncbi:hypothetical protein [Roseomonas chloroacetimidivorans]|uniref:hypothetical protein n=1 Tax=Roseomonas chloroacetimidivorans TaxID=1766656 RepID=UPI003C76D216
MANNYSILTDFSRYMGRPLAETIRAAADERRRILSDPSLTAEQQQAALQELEERTNAPLGRPAEGSRFRNIAWWAPAGSIAGDGTALVPVAAQVPASVPQGPSRSPLASPAPESPPEAAKPAPAQSAIGTGTAPVDDIATYMAQLAPYMSQRTPDDDKGMFQRGDTWWRIAAGLFKGDSLGDSLGNAAQGVADAYASDKTRKDRIDQQRSVVAAQALRDQTSRRDANSRFDAQQALTREQMQGQDRRADQTFQLQRDHYGAIERQQAESARQQDEARREARAARELSPGYRWVDENDHSKGQEFVPGGPADPALRNAQRGRTPIPESIVKIETPEIEGMQTHRNNIQDIDGLIGQIDGGKLDLSPGSRAGAWIRNSTGNSSESSRAVEECCAAITVRTRDNQDERRRRRSAGWA